MFVGQKAKEIYILCFQMKEEEEEEVNQQQSYNEDPFIRKFSLTE